jgi:predicted RNA-binding protein Jag
MGIFNIFKGSDKKGGKGHQTKANFIDDEWVEVSAASREEAVERACTALNATESHLEIKWLSKDGKKLRARKGSGQSQSKAASGGEKKTGNRKRKNSPKKQTQGGRRGNKRNERDDDRDGNSRGGARKARGSQNKNNSKQSSSRDAQNRRDEYDDADDFNDNQDNDYRDDDRHDSRRDEGYESKDSVRDDHEVFEEEFEEETNLGLDARDFLTKLVQFIDQPATVELYETNKTIRLEIESEESGLFIGKHGQTLDSIQHVMMKIFKEDDNPKFMVVDAEDYRVRREENLENKARKLAKKARKERRPVGVEPMNAIDRRIVHMALRGEPGVETKSIGEGSSRRVLIVPKGMDQRRGGRGGGRHQGRRGNGDRDGNQAPRREKEYEGPSRGGNDRGYDDYDY